jgi:glycosyltransferase involved in cell wall biosynthesis
MPRVTVVLPCYNHVQFVDETVRSLLAQSYRDFEIIAVDDGSTDGSLEALQRLEPNLHVMRQEHAGPAAARNRAIEFSDSEFIAFMDADDLCSPERLAVQIASLDKDRLDLVASELTFIDSNGNTLEGRWVCPPHACNDYWGSLLERNWAGTPSVTVRRSAIVSIGGFDEEFTHAEDYDLWLRTARLFRVGYVFSQLIRVRRHGHNLSRNIGAHQQFERRALRKVNPIEASAAFGRLYPDPQRQTEAWVWFLLRSGNEMFEQECHRAISQYPDSTSVEFAMGVFLYDLGAYDSSYDLFRKIKDEDVAGLNNFAVVSALRGDEEAAYSALRTAVAQRPGYHDAFLNLAALSSDSPLGITRRPLRSHLVP